MFSNKIIKNKDLSKKLKFFLIIFLFFSLSFLLFFVNYILAEEQQPSTGTGLENAAAAAGLGKTDVSTLIGKIIQVALGFVGVIFMILLTYGGFMWMTAGGNEEQVAKAKKLITSATIGLIIVIMAYAISYYITYTLVTVTEIK